MIARNSQLVSDCVKLLCRKGLVMSERETERESERGVIITLQQNGNLFGRVPAACDDNEDAT